MLSWLQVEEVYLGHVDSKADASLSLERFSTVVGNHGHGVLINELRLTTLRTCW